MSIITYKRNVKDLKQLLDMKNHKNQEFKPIEVLNQENEERLLSLKDKPVEELDEIDIYLIDISIQLSEEYTEEELAGLDIREKQKIYSNL